MNINKLINNMTLEEKIGQLVQITPNYYGEKGTITGPLYDDLDETDKFNVGSVLGTKNKEQVKRIQKIHLKNNRHKIPLIFMADIIHGYREIYPIPLALSCSWDLELIEEISSYAAHEARQEGINVTFSPMIDYVNDPRWGRVMESNGEDRLLNSKIAKAYINGYQNSKYSILSCPKHFIGYGLAEAGRDYASTQIDNFNLINKHLYPYLQNIDNLKIMMSSFNTINNIPVTANEFIIKDLLRDKMQFNGVLISDWGSIGELINHKIALNHKEASKIAIENETDIDMMSFSYISSLKNLVKEGELSEDIIDKSVKRVLNLKKELGLFDNPFKYLEEDPFKNNPLLLKSALDSIVLLKNNGILPLKRNQMVKICGPLSDNKNIIGNWSYEGNRDDVITSWKTFEKKKKIDDNSDIIVYFLGEEDNESGEARSKSNLNITSEDLNNIRRFKDKGKKVISVVHSGRPLILKELSYLSDAVVFAWHLGLKSSEAIYKTIYGYSNPSGKLTMSFPANMGQIPIYYDSLNTGRPQSKDSNSLDYVSQYIDGPNEPLYPFGFGLNYSDVRIEKIDVSSSKIDDNNNVTLSLNIINDSDYDTKEIVQLYVNDLVSKISRPNKELIDFKKVEIEANTNKKIKFEIKLNQLKYLNDDLSKTVEFGDFEIHVGLNSKDTFKRIITYE